jgi:hypothetical protein
MHRQDAGAEQIKALRLIAGILTGLLSYPV